jgi:hypothetical protein
MFSAKQLSADEYLDRVVPFSQKYCVKCHNRKDARGELDLTRYQKAADVTAHFRRWTSIAEFIRDGAMPPEDEQLQPTIDERNAVVETVRKLLLDEALKNAGDPGVVLPRRLSNTEYDLSVRDLTGIDIRPTRDFPADPAGGEGFDNTGEALGMSPSLLRKYLGAAQDVANHLVLKPHGIEFSPFPVTSYNERKKLTEQAIIDFYHQHDVSIREYLEAAWRFRHRDAAARDVSLDDWARQTQLSPKYFARIVEFLSGAAAGTGYVRQIGEQWNALPRPTTDNAVPVELSALERLIEFARRQIAPKEEQVIRSNAGNWPIQHLKFRAEVAAARDQFSPARFQTRQLVRFDRLRKPREDDQQQITTLTLRIDPAFENARGNFLIVRRAAVSRVDRFPNNDREREQHEAVSLKSVLEQHVPELAEKLAFGKHPLGHEIDAESFAVEAPALIELPFNAQLLAAVSDRHLVLDCELDPEHGREGAVLLQSATGRTPDTAVTGVGGESAELLVNRDSELVRGMVESAEQFCETFPNRFFYVDRSRGLAAGFHLVEGFFRDDRPLVQKVLSEQQIEELDRLWQELDFVTQHTETLLRGFVWFERAERHVLHDKRFDFLRSEDPKLVDDELLTRFEKVYLDKMGVKLVDDSLTPEAPGDRFDMIHGFFEDVRAGLQTQRALILTAEQHALRDIEQLARRAFHRELTPRDTESLRSLYQTLRKQGQSVEASLRGVLTGILMSPDFSYRYAEVAVQSGVQALSSNALASRLSYFLWSSLPDDELLAAAEDDGLQDEAALLAQTRRMLKDDRVSAFAREFLGQWLRYRDFLSKDPINPDTFPGYTDELRQAMFEEPQRFATFLIQEDRPVTELLTSDATFVNGVLAKHYGGVIADNYRAGADRWNAARRRDVTASAESLWHRVNGLRSSGRGGLFGMGVVLTASSAGERTSPVKRGFWTVHHLLGQHFPPPPADVPELPKSETEATKPLRELLIEHAANPRCAMCHVHFDGLGLALEGFDAIGRARTKDLAGRPVEDLGDLPNGESARGISGLIDYVETHRRPDFIQTLCRKFLGYALGRSVILSDQPLLQEMEAALEQNGYRFSVLFETVVASPQFRDQRGQQ